MGKLLILIPAYNEAENIERVVENLKENHSEYDYVVVNDGSKDETVSRDHALLRSYKHQPFWVMEQQSGACGWSKMGPTPTPGKLRLWTYQAVANGADTVVYFRWRACPRCCSGYRQSCRRAITYRQCAS